MKIGIDLSPIEKDPAGIGQYTLSLFSELCNQDRKNSYFIYTTTPFLFANATNKVIRVHKNLPANGLRWMWAVTKDIKKNKFDLFISPSNHLFAKLFPRTIQFVHDLAPLYYPEFFGRKGASKYKLTLTTAINNALSLLTISKTVQAEICEKYPQIINKIDFIYPGLNKWIELNSKDEQRILGDHNIDYEYILTLSTLEPRKNHINMIKAFDIFKKRTHSPLKLVIIGKKGWFFEDIFRIVSDFNLEKEVVFLGYIPNHELNTIIGNAKAFMFMSFYEGFGIPPLEALSLNIKTLVSDIPVFHEVYKEHALYTNPHSIDKIAGSLEDLLQRQHRNTDTFVKDNYSWEKSASKLLSIINEFK